MQHTLESYPVGNTKPLSIIAGPCVVENESTVMQCAEEIRRISDQHGVNMIFKASLDKANRTSDNGFRGVGIAPALDILRKVKQTYSLPIITDVHDCDMVELVAKTVDFLQIPAFLCRQTDLIRAAATTGLPVNIKKGQFLAPGDMQYVLEKALNTGNRNIMLVSVAPLLGITIWWLILEVFQSCALWAILWYLMQRIRYSCQAVATDSPVVSVNMLMFWLVLR